MGTYKVQENGKAPTGLAVGDHVVTGGGTYLITEVMNDGSYGSMLLNRSQTTANYRGSYDEPAAAGTAAGASGGAGDMPSFSDHLRSGGTAEDYYLRLLEQSVGSAAANAAAAGKTAAQTGISFEAAMQQAEQALRPQYEAELQRTAEKAGQKLEKAGLYDSLYGQALSAQAQNELSAALGEAVYKLALELADRSDEQRSAAVKQQSEQQKQALDYLQQLLRAGASSQ